ncbi:GTP-binding protein [Christensenellaceae bacterium OttesenSCG-928-K19]|nr:GTP-binding protein [Christensenellaceae bacterium OttesenSCG-928-K19]
MAQDFTSDSLDTLIDEIKNGAFGEVVRAKGIVFLEGKPQLLNITFHEVNCQLFTAYETPAITFIGRKLEKEKLLALGKSE